VDVASADLSVTRHHQTGDNIWARHSRRYLEADTAASQQPSRVVKKKLLLNREWVIDSLALRRSSQQCGYVADTPRHGNTATPTICVNMWLPDHDTAATHHTREYG
jgi:hypothetical protein